MRLEHITSIVYFVCAAMAVRNISIFSVSFRNKQKINAGVLNPFIYSSVMVERNGMNQHLFLSSVSLQHLTFVHRFPSVIALTKARASGVAERMLSTRPS